MNFICPVCKSLTPNMPEHDECYQTCLRIQRLTITIMITNSWTNHKYKRLRKKVFLMKQREHRTGLRVQLLGRLLEEYKNICETCLLYKCKIHPLNPNYNEGNESVNF